MPRASRHLSCPCSSRRRRYLCLRKIRNLSMHSSSPVYRLAYLVDISVILPDFLCSKSLQSANVSTRSSPVLHTSPFFSTWYLRPLSANNRNSPLPSTNECTEISVRRREVSLFEYLSFTSLSCLSWLISGIRPLYPHICSWDSSFALSISVTLGSLV